MKRSTVKTRVLQSWYVHTISTVMLFSAFFVPGFAQAADTDELSYTISISDPVFEQKQLSGESFSAIRLPNALTLAKKAGAPALPVQFVKFLIPPGKEVVDVTVSGKLQDLDTRGLDLTARPIFPHQRPVHFNSTAPVEMVMDQALYASHSAYPADDFCAQKVGYCRGYTILSLGLHPVKYVPAEGKVSIYSEMTVQIELEDSSNGHSLFRNKAEDRNWVRNLVFNPEVAQDYSNGLDGSKDYPGGLCDPADDYDYVIITTTHNSLDFWWPSSNTPFNWDDLMDKHNTTSGLKCTLVTMQDIDAESDYHNSNPMFNDTQAHIREFCKDAYQDWGVEYVLIGADAEWIKPRLMDYSYESDVDADIYWSHLDNTFNADGDSRWGEEGDSGFDLYGELFIGRLTADVPQDVSNWITKVFHYMDANDPGYLDNAAFFGGDTYWSCEGDDFMDFSAIKGTDNWLGPNPGGDPPYPSSLGFQYGFETWNDENPSTPFDLTVKWTAEPPNPGGWMGGSHSSAINGLKNAINDDACTLISGIAHADEHMSLDVGASSWESSYHNTRPFFIHDYGCHCGDMDAADDGVLHSMLFHSDTELAFGCVYNTCYGWGNFDHTGSSSSVQQKAFWDYMFDMGNCGNCDQWQLGKAQGFSKDILAPLIDYDPDYGTWRAIIQGCLLFGDPAVTIKPPGELTLSKDASSISATTGGSVNFNLDAGTEHNGRKYYLLASITGTYPGTPAGDVTLPLNWDAATDLSIALANTPYFVDSFGTLDAQGQGSASFNVGPKDLRPAIGNTLSFAYLLNKPLDFASNAVNVGVVN